MYCLKKVSYYNSFLIMLNTEKILKNKSFNFISTNKTKSWHKIQQFKSCIKRVCIPFLLFLLLCRFKHIYFYNSLYPRLRVFFPFFKNNKVATKTKHRFNGRCQLSSVLSSTSCVAHIALMIAFSDYLNFPLLPRSQRDDETMEWNESSTNASVFENNKKCSQQKHNDIPI